MAGKLGNEVALSAMASRGPIDDRGWSTIEIPVERTANAVCDILSLSVEATLLSPEPLILALGEAIDEMTRRYTTKGSVVR